MNKVVLDASALLTLISQEKGSDAVAKALPDAIMSTVNLSEVAAILLHRLHIPEEEVRPMLSDLVESISFDETQAYIAAELMGTTKHKGLSFGDRACLALGIKLKRPVLTADKAWTDIKTEAQVILIR